MPLRYGIIGYPLSHSFSPAYFTQKFATSGIAAFYDPYPLGSISELGSLLRRVPELAGLNVTIPYKESVIPLLSELSEVAASVGAVNCIRISAGKLTGHNTDVVGFRESLEPLLRNGHGHALVLGTGGAARAVKWVLDALGISVLSVSRAGNGGAIPYSGVTAQIVQQHRLIINTTPLGMYPDVEAAPPLPYSAVGSDHLLYDLIYNPAETRFLQLGRTQGATIKNGHEMLIRQAEASWDIWNPTYAAHK